MTVHVVLSGGLDSTAALAWSRAQLPEQPHTAVSFDYGQRHRRELQAASDVAVFYDMPHAVVELRGLLAGSALLGATDVPEGKYDAPSMSATVVQGRNLLFAAATIARTQPGDTVVVGVHAGDHPIYADCRPDFWDALRKAAKAYDVKVCAPWLHVDKADVVLQGARFDAPLALTWSCYKGGELHCGRCGTCVERAEAFALAGVEDPTTYVDPAYWRDAVRT